MCVSFEGPMDLAQWAEKSSSACGLWCLSFHMGKEYARGDTCDLDAGRRRLGKGRRVREEVVYARCPCVLQAGRGQTACVSQLLLLTSTILCADLSLETIICRQCDLKDGSLSLHRSFYVWN